MFQSHALNFHETFFVVIWVGFPGHRNLPCNSVKNRVWATFRRKRLGKLDENLIKTLKIDREINVLFRFISKKKRLDEGVGFSSCISDNYTCFQLALWVFDSAIRSINWLIDSNDGEVRWFSVQMEINRFSNKEINCKKMSRIKWIIFDPIVFGKKLIRGSWNRWKLTQSKLLLKKAFLSAFRDSSNFCTRSRGRK
jgi:hypothetical protein